MLKHHERFQKTTLAELIEEDKGARWKHRKLKRRLISYNNHLQQTMMYSSAVLYLSTVKSFYRYFEIEIHTLSGLNKKNSIFLFKLALRIYLTRRLSDSSLKSQHLCFNLQSFLWSAADAAEKKHWTDHTRLSRQC